MPNENGCATFDNFTLHLESIIWVWRVNYPNTIVVLGCRRCTSNLLLRNWGLDGGGVLEAGKAKLFPEEILISFNAHFLSIPNEFVAAEHVDIVNLCQLVDRSSHGTRVLTFARARYLISFRNVWARVSDVENYPALRILVLNHNRVTPSETSIGVVGPWNLFIRLLIF